MTDAGACRAPRALANHVVSLSIVRSIDIEHLPRSGIKEVNALQNEMLIPMWIS